MNSLRSAWTPFLAVLSEAQMQAKEDSEVSENRNFRNEVYSLSDWYKKSGRSFDISEGLSTSHSHDPVL